MKLAQKIEIEVEGETLKLVNVTIASENYNIEICNYDSHFRISFFKGNASEAFAIRISDEGSMKIERLIRRIGHDHDDHEFFVEAGVWAKGIASALSIPFGMRKIVEPTVY